MSFFRWFSFLNPFRKNKSEQEQLEVLEKEILYYDDLRRSNLEMEKRIISCLLLYSILVYLLASVCTFFYFTPTSSWLRMLLYTASLVTFPFLIYVIKILLHKIFVWHVKSKEMKLKDLRSRKTKLLEIVKETIPYAKAKEILDRFDPLGFHRTDFEHPIKKPAPSPLTPINKENGASTSLTQGVTRVGDPSDVRRRSTLTDAPQPHQRVSQLKFQMSNSAMQGFPPGNRIVNVNHPPPPSNQLQLARPIVPQERSFLDRMVDYLVGDGPENRFALICRRCHGHNGMALAEEFEFLSFRCCFCGFNNPSRKQRPMPPPFKIDSENPREETTSQESEQTSGVSDDETKPSDSTKEREFNNVAGAGDKITLVDSSSEAETLLNTAEDDSSRADTIDLPDSTDMTTETHAE